MKWYHWFGIGIASIIAREAAAQTPPHWTQKTIDGTEYLCLPKGEDPCPPRRRIPRRVLPPDSEKCGTHFNGTEYLGICLDEDAHSRLDELDGIELTLGPANLCPGRDKCYGLTVETLAAPELEKPRSSLRERIEELERTLERLINEKCKPAECPECPKLPEAEPLLERHSIGLQLGGSESGYFSLGASYGFRLNRDIALEVAAGYVKLSIDGTLTSVTESGEVHDLAGGVQQVTNKKIAERYSPNTDRGYLELGTIIRLVEKSIFGLGLKTSARVTLYNVDERRTEAVESFLFQDGAETTPRKSAERLPETSSRTALDLSGLAGLLFQLSLGEGVYVSLVTELEVGGADIGGNSQLRVGGRYTGVVEYRF